jgi:hypothetical protein
MFEVPHNISGQMASGMVGFVFPVKLSVVAATSPLVKNCILA